MSVTITAINRGTTPGDGTGDTAYDGIGIANTNFTNLKAGVEGLQGRYWTIQNSSTTLALGGRYAADNHAGITLTAPAAFAISATDYSDVWVCNADDASNITLTPASGDAFFVDGATLGIDTSQALAPGELAFLIPRTTNSEWNLYITGGTGGGGWTNMTEAVWTGGTQSEVADGASAVAFDFDTDNAYGTSGANLLRLSNNATPVFDFSYQGGIDFANSGATTANHSQSLGLNWISSSDSAASGQYSLVIGAYNKASSDHSMAFGYNNVVSGIAAGAYGWMNVVESNYGWAFGQQCKLSTNATVANAGGHFATQGDAQTMFIALKVATTDATPTTMLAQGIRINVPVDHAWVFTVQVIARSDETDGNVHAAWELKGAISRDEASNTVLIGSPSITSLAADADAIAGGWAVTAVANNGSNSLDIDVTGEAATNIRWVASATISQVGYA